MAFKEKPTPPALRPEGANAASAGAAPVLTENRFLRVNPEVDARLTSFMEANPKMTDYYSDLVKQNPDRAVRALMLGKMMRHEAQMRQVERQLPQAKQWAEQQPGMLERLNERLKNINPFYREKAFVREAAKAKAELDFTPKVSAGARASL